MVYTCNIIFKFLKLNNVTKKGSLYYSDEHTAYASLELIGKHRQISHNKDEYVIDDTHINVIEGFWSYAKMWSYQYRRIHKQYFPLYLKEIEFRFNNRNSDLYPIISKILVKTVADL